jgi:hypothetical protein
VIAGGVPSWERVRAGREEPIEMTQVAFVTASGHANFPGALATVNSILLFHPDADVFVVSDPASPLAPSQVRCLRASERVRLIDSGARDDQHRIDAGQLRAMTCRDAAATCDVVASIDAGCVLCSDAGDVIERCQTEGGFVAGGVGDGEAAVDRGARAAGEAPASTWRHVDPALFFCATTPRTRDALARWASCATAATRPRPGASAGDGDGAALGELLTAVRRAGGLELVDDRLWGQHANFWESIIDFRGGRFVNVSASGARQRSFNCDGVAKFWLAGHRERVVDLFPLQTYPYVWFLAMLWFGRCSDWSLDPHEYLPGASRHLLEDLVHFLPQIEQVLPQARYRWNGLTDTLIRRALEGMQSVMPLGGGSMNDVMEIVAAHPWIRRYVEVGSYEGGSILTLGLRFLNRDVDFYAVESFMGNLDGTTDGFTLPSRSTFLERLARFPGLRVRLVPGDSVHAAALFDAHSLDCVFIDACHATPAVLRDIDVWLPKLARPAILAGDDYDFGSVFDAVHARFPHVNVTQSGVIWWIRFE